VTAAARDVQGAPEADVGCVSPAGPQLGDPDVEQRHDELVVAGELVLPGPAVLRLQHGPRLLDRALQLAGEPRIEQARHRQGDVEAAALGGVELHVRLLRHREVRRGGRGIPAEQARGGRGDGELGVRDEVLARDAVEQNLDGLRGALEIERHPVVPQQRGRPLPVVRQQRVLDRGQPLPGLGIPARRPPVQRRQLLGRLTAQLAAEQLRHELVVAERPIPIRDPRDERVRTLEPGEQSGAVMAVGKCVSEVRSEAVDDARAHEELPHPPRLAGQHLGDEVVGERPVVAGERVDERGHVLHAARREGGDAKPGGPALGAPPQPIREHRRERLSERREQVGRLGRRECELIGPDLGERTVQPQLVQRQVGIAPGGGDEPQSSGPVRDHVTEVRHRLGRRELVQVVDHKHERAFKLRQGGDQMGVTTIASSVGATAGPPAPSV
jgi:hypothetical protein